MGGGEEGRFGVGRSERSVSTSSASSSGRGSPRMLR